jgi:hypothetical protein
LQVQSWIGLPLGNDIKSAIHCSIVPVISRTARTDTRGGPRSRARLSRTSGTARIRAEMVPFSSEAASYQ